tara:strand:+ start:23 stop:517 length:495 start_codon:yes stop_codon:yes gene_type:complete
MALTQVRGSGISNMVISDAGIFTRTLQPAFLVQPATAQLNIPINATTTLAWGTERFDIGGNFASDVFTAPVTGKYHFGCTLRFENIDSAADYYLLTLKTSNREYKSWNDPGGFSGDLAYNILIVDALADMDASDTAYITISQDNTGTAQADVHVDSYFWGYLVA